MIVDDFDRSWFETALLHLLKELSEKQAEVNTMEMEFVNLCEGKAHSTAMHLEIIKYCRKINVRMIDVMTDLRDYFTELRLESVHEFYVSIFRLFIKSLKILSESYLHIVKELKVLKCEIEAKQNNYQANKNSNGNCHCGHVNKQRQYRQLEHMDFLIDQIESKQQIIEKQMSNLISNIEEEKNSIVDKKPNNKPELFKQVSKTFQQITDKAQLLFNAYVQSNSDKVKFFTPEQIQKYFKEEIGLVMAKFLRQSFETGNTYMTDKFKQKFEQWQLEQKRAMIMSKLDQIKELKKTNHLSQKSVRLLNQTSEQLFSSNSKKLSIREQEEKLIKQLKSIMDINEYLRRENLAMGQEVDELKGQLAEAEGKCASISNQYKELEKTFIKKTFQFEEAKAEFNWKVQSHLRESSASNFRKSEFDKQCSILSGEENKFGYTDQSIKVIKREDNYTQTQFNCFKNQSKSGQLNGIAQPISSSSINPNQMKIRTHKRVRSHQKMHETSEMLLKANIGTMTPFEEQFLILAEEINKLLGLNNKLQNCMLAIDDVKLKELKSKWIQKISQISKQQIQKQGKKGNGKNSHKIGRNMRKKVFVNKLVQTDAQSVKKSSAIPTPTFMRREDKNLSSRNFNYKSTSPHTNLDKKGSEGKSTSEKDYFESSFNNFNNDSEMGKSKKKSKMENIIFEELKFSGEGSKQGHLRKKSSMLLSLAQSPSTSRRTPSQIVQPKLEQIEQFNNNCQQSPQQSPHESRKNFLLERWDERWDEMDSNKIVEYLKECQRKSPSSESAIASILTEIQNKESKQQIKKLVEKYQSSCSTTPTFSAFAVEINSLASKQ